MKLDIIKLANDAGVYSGANEFVFRPSLERLAALVLEEAAKIIEAQDVDPAFKGRMASVIRDLKVAE